jgi:hypothetical protein
MPTQYRQLVSVEQRSEGAVIYNGRQFRTRAVLVGDIFTAVGRIDVGPSYGTGPAVIQVLTGFRPKAILVMAVMNRVTDTASVSAPCSSTGITVDDGGTLIRYCRTVARVAASSYSAGDENGRVFSGPFSYRLYRTTTPTSKTLTAIDGNITALNDSGFSIEVNNDYPYKIAFMAFGGNITVAHGKFTVDNTMTATANFPFIPDSLIVIDLPRWNDELIYYQQTSGTNPTRFVNTVPTRFFYGRYQGSTACYLHYGVYSTTNSASGNFPFFTSTASPTSVRGTFRVSSTTLTIGSWQSSSPRYTSEALYLALSGLPLKITSRSFTVNANTTVNVIVTLDFEPGTMIIESSTNGIVFDPHERSPDWVCVNLGTGEAGTFNTTIGAYLWFWKRSAGSGNYFYGTVRNTSTSSSHTGAAYFLQFASAQSTTQRELTLFVSSWYRQFVGIRKRWAKLLSTFSNYLVSLFYRSNRRTQMEMELSVSSDHESSLFQALTKLLFVRGFSISEIIDTTWGRNLRPIRLLTPSDIDVCRGDQLVLRLKTRHANHDRDMRAMNDIVRMALLDYRTGNPVYWLGLGSGIEYDEKGQAVITIPWDVLDSALGRERICRYRVELWPDERLGAAGWIVHVGTIREVR